jgi:hypothetical protein
MTDVRASGASSDLNDNNNNNNNSNEDGFVFSVKQDEVHFVDKPSQNLLCPVCQERKEKRKINHHIHQTHHHIHS